MVSLAAGRIKADQWLQSTHVVSANNHVATNLQARHILEEDQRRLFDRGESMVNSCFFFVV